MTDGQCVDEDRHMYNTHLDTHSDGIDRGLEVFREIMTRVAADGASVEAERRELRRPLWDAEMRAAFRCPFHGPPSPEETTPCCLNAVVREGSK